LLREKSTGITLVSLAFSYG